MSETGYDYRIHMELSEQLRQSGSITTPHLILQLAVALLAVTTPLTIRMATITLLASGIAAAAWFIYRLLAVEGARGAAPLTMVLLVVAPPALLFPFDQHLYLGYLSTNVFHNPTILLLKPLALLSFAQAVATLQRSSPRPRYQLIACVLITVACALTKPSFTICILPALALLILLRLRHHHPDWPMFLAGFIIPALLVLAAQYQLTYSAAQLPGVYQGSSAVILAPLAVMQNFSSWLTTKFCLSLLFPLTLVSCYYREARGDLPLQLAWIAFAIGTGYTYLLAESGPRMMQGNFTWSAQITLFILFVYSVRFLLANGTMKSSDNRLKRLICHSALAMHLLSGILFYLAEFLQTERYW